jgi:hypothetical protein
MTHRKTKKILPGDLIAYPDKLSNDNPVVLIISASEYQKTSQEVIFMILGEESILDGVTCNNEYLLLSRV